MGEIRPEAVTPPPRDEPDEPVCADASAPEVTQDPFLGTTLGGQYRLDGVIGKGATSRVYRAHQVTLGREVAVKLMLPGIDPDGQQRFEERFFREASLAGSLQHPNVVTVHDFGRTEDRSCFIVMELLAGTNLKEAMRGGPLDQARVLDIFEQVVRGLRHAHKAGLVHRDMKPGNIRLVPAEEGHELVKIMDFGLVKAMSTAEADDPDELGEIDEIDPASDEVSELTQAGTFMGTPHYASPEQAQGYATDARSDLYSVGVMMYRALTGKLPFYSTNPMSIAAAQVREPYPPMARRAPEVDVPAVLEKIVRRCMEKDPARRYQDAGELLADVKEARRLLAPGAEPSSIAAWPAIEPPESVLRRRGIPLWPLALMALGLLAIAGVAWLGFLLRPEPELPYKSAAPSDEAAESVRILADDIVSGDTPAPPREVYLLISSEPSGAEVSLDGALLGTTPLARKISIRADEVAPVRRFVVSRAGWRDEAVELDLSGDQATANVVLERVPRAASAAPAAPVDDDVAAPRIGPAAPASSPPAAGAVTADGVAFTAEEAAATLAFVNEAPRETLAAAGVAGRQVNIILQGRPFADLAAFAATPYIGEKTVASLKQAAGAAGR